MATLGHSPTPGASTVKPPIAVGWAGAGTCANGSLIGEEGEIQVPVVPGTNPPGAVAGPPKTPKLLPVVLGPPILRSMVALPWMFTAGPALEFTSMLCCGPPL